MYYSNCRNTAFLLRINNHCSPYANVNINCRYLEMEKLSDLNPAKFTVLSLNIQSLPAKYVEFSELIYDFSSPDLFPDVICLQETWKIIIICSPCLIIML